MTEIRVVELEEQPTAVMGEQVPMADLTEFFGRAFATVMEVVGRQGARVAGPPFAMYHGTPSDTVDVDAGFPVSAPVEAVEGVRAAVLPGGRAAEATHIGPYDTLAQTYGEMMRWIEEQGLEPGTDMWEQYLTDPETEPDPTNWRTRVLCPLR